MPEMVGVKLAVEVTQDVVRHWRTEQLRGIPVSGRSFGQVARRKDVPIRKRGAADAGREHTV